MSYTCMYMCGCHSLVIGQAVNEGTHSLSVGGKGFSVPLFLVLMFLPFSLLETSGSAQNPFMAMLEVSTPSSQRHIQVSLLLRAVVCVCGGGGDDNCPCAP